MLEIDGVKIKQGLCFKHRRRNAGSIEHFVLDVTNEAVTFRRNHHNSETLTVEKFKKIFEKEVVPYWMLEAAYLEHHYFVLRERLGEAVNLQGLWEDLRDQYEDPYDHDCYCYDD